MGWAEMRAEIESVGEVIRGVGRDTADLGREGSAIALMITGRLAGIRTELDATKKRIDALGSSPEVVALERKLKELDSRKDALDRPGDGPDDKLADLDARERELDKADLDDEVLGLRNVIAFRESLLAKNKTYNLDGKKRSRGQEVGEIRQLKLELEEAEKALLALRKTEEVSEDVRRELAAKARAEERESIALERERIAIEKEAIPLRERLATLKAENDAARSEMEEDLRRLEAAAGDVATILSDGGINGAEVEHLKEMLNLLRAMPEAADSAHAALERMAALAGGEV